MFDFASSRELLLFAMPLVGAWIIVKGTGLGAMVDTVVTVCAMIALLSFAHIIDISSLLGPN